MFEFRACRYNEPAKQVPESSVQPTPNSADLDWDTIHYPG